MPLDLTAITTALSNLTPTQTLLLGQHLSTSNYAKALGVLAQMSANPAVAPSLYSVLAGIPGIPAAVLTAVGAALGLAGAAFQAAMTQATEQLQQAFSSENALQQAGIG